MRKTKSLALALALIGTSAAAAAQPRAYAGLDLFYWRYSLGSEWFDDRDDATLRAGTLRARGGLEFTPFLAVEVHGAAGGSDERRVLGIRSEASLDYLAAVFGRANLPLGDCCAVYGLLGASQAQGEFSALGFSAETESTSSWSYGLGAEVQVMPNLYLGTDWIMYLDDEDYDLSAWSFGGRFRF